MLHAVLFPLWFPASVPRGPLEISHNGYWIEAASRPSKQGALQDQEKWVLLVPRPFVGHCRSKYMLYGVEIQIHSLPQASMWILAGGSAEPLSSLLAVYLANEGG